MNNPPTPAKDDIPTWGEHNLHQRIKKRQADPDSLSQELRIRILFWLDKMLEVTYKQSDKDMHKITAGITADQLVALLSQEIVKELNNIKLSLRGEDPDQYRPGDMLSKGLVEGVLDDYISFWKEQK